MNHEIQPQIGESIAEAEIKPRLGLVVLGENLKHGWPARRLKDSVYNLSISSKIQAIAATLEAIRYQNAGYEVDIINSTGDTAGIGIGEAEGLSSYERKGGFYPNGMIINETNSLETPGNAEYTANILKQRQYDKLVLLTAKDHMKRSRKLFEAFGIQFDEHNASEDIYLADPTVSESTLERRRNLISRYRKSVWGTLERIKEGIFAFELNFDHKGKLIHKIVGGYRARRNKRHGLQGQSSTQPAHA